MRRALLISTLAAALLGAPAVAAAADGGAMAPPGGGGASYGATAPQPASEPEDGGGAGGADVQQVAAQRRAAEKRRAALKRRLARRRAAAAKRRASRLRAQRRELARERRIARKRSQQRRRRAAAKPAPAPAPAPSSDHVFPVKGSFSFGGAGSRFGAGRPGHIHQGQDLSAPLGTPLVAPWAGTIETIKFQPGGAGLYIVLDGDGEDRDYVFMHLRRGSLRVSRGQSVAKGQQLAEVGSTGSSSGPHLHFEIWVGGGWYTGGRPIDPLPYLRAWLG